MTSSEQTPCCAACNDRGYQRPGDGIPIACECKLGRMWANTTAGQASVFQRSFRTMVDAVNKQSRIDLAAIWRGFQR